MPVYNRRSLRQNLGQLWLHDLVIGQTSGSIGAVGSMTIIDASQADPTAADEQMYQRHWLRLLGSVGQIQDVRVAGYNTGSGAYISPVAVATTIFSGMPFEVHGMLSPTDKDKALDVVIGDVRYRQELAVWSIDQSHVYSMGTDVQDVLDVRYLSDPTDSLNTGGHLVRWWKYERTGSGQQLRISPPLLYSQQLIVDAIFTPTLGAGDLATVYLPSDQPVLAGAAARCYWMLEGQGPAQEVATYRARRQEAARAYTRLSARFQPVVTRKQQLDEPW